MIRNAYFLTLEEVNLIKEKTGIQLKERESLSPMEAFILDEFEFAFRFLDIDHDQAIVEKLQEKSDALIEEFNTKYIPQLDEEDDDSIIIKLMDAIYEHIEIFLDKKALEMAKESIENDTYESIQDIESSAKTP